jgi:hypothetical protein
MDQKQNGRWVSRSYWSVNIGWFFLLLSFQHTRLVVDDYPNKWQNCRVQFTFRYHFIDGPLSSRGEKIVWITTNPKLGDYFGQNNDASGEYVSLATTMTKMMMRNGRRIVVVFTFIPTSYILFSSSSENKNQNTLSWREILGIAFQKVSICSSIEPSKNETLQPILSMLLFPAAKMDVTL